MSRTTPNAAYVRCVWFATIGAALLVAASLGSGDYWLSRIATDLRLHLGAACIVLITVALVLRLRHAVMVLAVTTVMNTLAGISTVRETVVSDCCNSVSVRVATINLDVRNADHASVKFLLENAPLDIVLLQEYTFAWQDSLLSVHERFPYRIEAAANGAFGIALFSNLPLADAVVHEFSSGRSQYVRATVRVHDRDVDVLGLHLEWPMTPWALATQQRQLDDVITMAQMTMKPMLLCGDLNMTPWSGSFRRLLRDGHFEPPARMLVSEGSWPALLPPFARIGIDHCLAQHPFGLALEQIGPGVGSDHLPVLYRFGRSHTAGPAPARSNGPDETT